MSSSSPPFGRLPDVLTQLVMQSLTLSELLQFARCSRRLASQADSAFAFKHVRPMVRLWNFSSPPLVLTKLMRHVSLTLKPTVRSKELVLLLSQLPARLYGLDTSNIAVSVADCVELLSHPCMQSLSELTLDNRQSWCLPDVIATVARLPSLHTLSMMGWHESPPSADVLRLLSNASITSLHVRDRDFCAPSRLSAIAGLPNLRHLTVAQPFIYDDEWVGLFASPSLCKLTSLTLDWCIFTGPSDCEPLNPDHAAAVFASLTQLSSLHLKMPFGVDVLLPSLRFAPALTALTVEADCAECDTKAASVLPSYAVLLSLMVAQPSLRVELDLLDHESSLRDECVPKLASEFAAAPADVRSRLTVFYGKPLWR